jgi:hypothetical protein
MDEKRSPFAGEKVTIYRMGVFGSERIEAAEAIVALDVRGGLGVRWREPRKRTWKGCRESGEFACLVVLQGHGHPEQPRFEPSPDGRGEITRFTCFAPEWRPDFDRFLAAYLAENPAAVVLRDYRAAASEVAA